MPRSKTDDTTNAYAYAMGDLGGAFIPTCDKTLTGNSVCVAKAGHAWRHFLHLKKTGTQDFVFVYDDVGTTQGFEKHSFIHYIQNGQANEGGTAFDPATLTVTSWGRATTGPIQRRCSLRSWRPLPTADQNDDRGPGGDARLRRNRLHTHVEQGQLLSARCGLRRRSE